jgi:hypothetical protein
MTPLSLNIIITFFIVLRGNLVGGRPKIFISKKANKVKTSNTLPKKSSLFE